MPVTIPTTWPGVNLAPLAPGQPILEVDLVQIIQADAHSYAYKGSVLHGVVYDPAWSTTSTTFTAANGSVSPIREDLNQRWPSGHVLRRAWELTPPGTDPYDGSNVWHVAVSVAGSDLLEVRAELWIDGVGGVDSVDILVGPTEYAVGFLTLPESAGSDLPYLKFSARSTTGALVYLHGLTAYESILVVDQMPLQE